MLLASPESTPAAHNNIETTITKHFTHSQKCIQIAQYLSPQTASFVHVLSAQSFFALSTWTREQERLSK